MLTISGPGEGGRGSEVQMTKLTAANQKSKLTVANQKSLTL